MRQTKISQVDCTTGEILEGVVVVIPTKQKMRSGFMLTSLEGVRRLAMDRDLNLTDRRVLDVLMTCLDYENWMCVTQKEIAGVLGVHRPNVAKSLKKLLDKAIIVKGEKWGKTNCYRLNAFYGWKGRINKEYQDTYETHTKLLS